MRLEEFMRTGPAALVVMCLLAGCSSQAGAPTEAGAAGLKPAASAEKGKPSESDASSVPPAPSPQGAPEKVAASDADQTQAEPPAADVPAMIEGFQSPSSVRVFTATEQFRKLPADVRRNVLTELSAQDSASVRHHAWRAFATWATRDDVPTLIAALASPHDDVREAALALLARFPNAETIGVLTGLLEDPASRERAEELLVGVGPAAEQALLEYAAHMDAGLRSAAWRILGQIGGRKSLLRLEQVATQGDYQKDPVLQSALEQIRERLRK